MSLGNLSRLSSARSRSISPENPTGEIGKGAAATEGTGATAARDLGIGWKISPSIEIAPTEVEELAAISECGAIKQIWITASGVRNRDLILRMYWNGQENPSVEVPLGDFFCCGLEQYAHVSSLPVCVNPGMAFNCFWEMPYSKSAFITLENRDDRRKAIVYYQINYTITEVPEDFGYFHAQFRRENPVPYKQPYTLLDGISGQGHYVGTYMAWGVNNSGWWGEGEFKFYLDDDHTFPTICSTGTEDYFLGSFNFDPGAVRNDLANSYKEYTTPYAGLPQIIRPDGVYRSQQRFGMYRWHIADPVRFRDGLRVTVQPLGWRDFGVWGGDISTRRYLPLQDDLSSVAFWYQALPTSPFPELPDRDYMEIN